MKKEFELKNKDTIMALLPTKDNKFIVMRATVEDKEIENLSEAVVVLPEQNGKKPKLKFPFLLERDLKQLSDKYISDINEYFGNNTDEIPSSHSQVKEDILSLFKRRFNE